MNINRNTEEISFTQDPLKIASALFKGQARLVAAREVPPDQRLISISGNGRLRWLIPPNSASRFFMKSWLPLGYLRQIGWNFLLKVIDTPLVNFIPGVKTIGVAGVNLGDWARTYWDVGENTLPVIYVGTEGYRRKAVVGIVDESDCKAIAKIPLGPEAASGINTEVRAISEVNMRLYGHIPQMYRFEDLSGFSIQEYIPLETYLHPFGSLHTEILGSLLLEKTSDLESFGDRWVKNQDPQIAKLGRHILRKIQPDILRRQFRLSYFHGDLIPWNFKKGHETKLYLLDWEYFEEEGLPLTDIAYFKFLWDSRIGGLSGAKFLRSFHDFLDSEPVIKHAERVGVQKSDVSFLGIVGLFDFVVRRIELGLKQSDVTIPVLLQIVTQALDLDDLSIRSTI